ncbi:MAG TPA: hypothetical protein VF767_12685 [Bryobacteraceae bacterium]
MLSYCWSESRLAQICVEHAGMWESLPRQCALLVDDWSVLPPHLQKMEDQLIERKEPNGLHVGAIWKLSERPC